MAAQATPMNDLNFTMSFSLPMIDDVQFSIGACTHK
jgi:hypothetical protein